MNHPRRRSRKAQEASSKLLPEKLNPGFISTEAATDELKNVGPHPTGSSTVHAAPPLMLRPRIALRRLCRGTGCEVGLSTLYLWIATGKIDSVRVGDRIFIPAQVVDNLIERCLMGDRMY